MQFPIAIQHPICDNRRKVVLCTLNSGLQAVVTGMMGGVPASKACLPVARTTSACRSCGSLCSCLGCALAGGPCGRNHGHHPCDFLAGKPRYFSCRGVDQVAVQKCNYYRVAFVTLTFRSASWLIAMSISLKGKMKKYIKDSGKEALKILGRG